MRISSLVHAVDAHACGERAVVPVLGGQAWITGMATYMLDLDDPFPEGFTVGDIW